LIFILYFILKCIQYLICLRYCIFQCINNRRLKTRNSSTIGTSASVRLDYDSYIWFLGFPIYAQQRQSEGDVTFVFLAISQLLIRFGRLKVTYIHRQIKFEVLFYKSKNMFFPWNLVQTIVTLKSSTNNCSPEI